MSKEESLRNEIDVDVAYVDDYGVKGIKTVHIAFISQAISRDYINYVKTLIEIQQLGEKSSKLVKDMGYLVSQKTEVTTNESGEIVIKDKSLAEIRAIMKDKVREHEDTDARLNELTARVDDMRFALIKKILLKNGIDDADMNRKEWWDDCVDKTDVSSFIREACTKDNELIERKKKVLIPTSTM